MRKLKLIVPLLTTIFMVGCGTTNSSSSTTPNSNNSIVIKDLVVEGTNLEGQGGTYNYTLVARPNLTLTMDIDLDVRYQEIDGKYNFHYEIDENKSHHMIVSGRFKNIIVESPLVEQLNPGIVTKFVKIAESIGFFKGKEQNDSYEWIEELCADPQNWVEKNISNDSYSYELELKTGEGFSFVNVLSLLIYEEEHGYSISFEVPAE